MSFGLQVFRVGVRVTLGIAAASIVYALATPDGANRGWLLAISVAVVLGALTIAALPRRRLIERGGATWVLAGWTIAHLIGSTAATLLDGGDSPYAGLFFVLVVYAAVALPRRHVIVVTAVAVVAFVLSGYANAGADGYAFWSAFIRVVALVSAAAVCATIAADRRRQVATLHDHKVEVVRRLALVVEHRDTDTGGHVERIGAYAALLGDELGFSAADRERLRLAATLHDVGKVAIADAILLKPGPLTPDERREIERHAAIGHRMLAGSGSDVLNLAATIAISHHERWDGAGYPNRLRGEDIPLSGRIVAVADVFDALTSDRVYKAAMPTDEALEIIRAGAGSQFDPAIVDAFFRRIDGVRRVQAAYREPAADAGLQRAPLVA